MDFKEMVAATKPKVVPDDVFVHLVFDPGHTTGWCAFEGIELKERGQIDTQSIDVATPSIMELFDIWVPNVVIYEDYRIYKWRQKHHVGSELMTTQVIGCIKTISAIGGIPTFTQPAQIAKAFCTDKKLKAWGFYDKGQRHSNDAVRHGCYAILFGTVQRKHKGSYNKTVG